MAKTIGIKAFIYNKDRTRDIVVITKKNKSEDGNSFHTKKKKEYLLKGEKAIVTSQKVFGINRHYVTYHYQEDCPEPLDMVNFNDIKFVGISSGDLRAIFTPRFYQIIARAGKNAKNEQIMFLLALYSAAAISFLLFMWYKHFGFSFK